MKKTNYYKINGLIFLVILFSFFTINMFKSDSDKSELENRTLKKKPKFDIDNIVSGRYQSKLESYINDQFFIRDNFIKLKSSSDSVTLKKENNGIYFGKDDFLFEKVSELNEERVNNNIDSIKKFMEQYSDMNFYFELVPTSATIYKDKLPDNAPIVDEQLLEKEIKDKMPEKLKFISPYDSLVKNSEQYIYYKTDHHWTTLGAYLGYTDFCSEASIEPYTLDNYDCLEVTDSFYGTLFSKSLHSVKEPDKINIYLPKGEDERQNIVEYVDEKEVTGTFYDTSYLSKTDKYSVFFKSNHPLIKISTVAEGNKSIVIFKDSYANSFVPFLTQNYSKIYMVDPRYYCDNINDVMKEAGKEADVLFLYNYNTFATDNNLCEVLNNYN